MLQVEAGPAMGLPMDVQDPDLVIDNPGHVIEGQGHAIEGQGHMIDDPGHMIEGQDHVIEGQGHMIDGPGHVIEGLGPSQMIGTQGHVDVDHDQDHMIRDILDEVAGGLGHVTGRESRQVIITREGLDQEINLVAKGEDPTQDHDQDHVGEDKTLYSSY